MLKLIRAVNDNVASMFYNATHSLGAYFWIGFCVTLFSLACAYFLTNIHEAVIETTQAKEKEKLEELRADLQHAGKKGRM